MAAVGASMAGVPRGRSTERNRRGGQRRPGHGRGDSRRASRSSPAGPWLDKTRPSDSVLGRGGRSVRGGEEWISPKEQGGSKAVTQGLQSNTARTTEGSAHGRDRAHSPEHANAARDEGTQGEEGRAGGAEGRRARRRLI